jgi:glycosyltransferase involved in cell wall biosynthesis
MTDRAPVSACLIVKNEAGQIESCLKSIRPYVAELCVVDTGSTDETPEIVKRYADKFEVYTDCNDENGLIASFAMARQRSFELAEQPWVIWIDGDDEVQGADKLAEIIAKYDADRNGKPALVLMPYEYSHDEHGNVTCLHSRERLATPKEAFKWIGPVHEVLNPDVPDVQMFETEQVRMIHRRSESNKVMEPGRNLRILKAHYEKVGEGDVRQLYYLGLEYGNVGDLANALKFHKRYVELSGWDDEKFHACLKIVEHYQSIGHYEDAVEWATKALVVREGWAEAYFSLAKSFYFMAQRGGREERRNWERSVHFARLGLQLPPTRTILFVNPMEREYGIHKFLNFALNKIGVSVRMT